MPHEHPPGMVKLVGAGPGSADLLTLRAARAIENAEALLYDALVADEILALAPAACVKIQTGKRAGRTSMKQETINRLMVRMARRGLRVVRLKGGDPSVFGRVGEERAFLARHGIASEVIPGVTAASAAAAQLQMPLTHRGEARRLLLATATLRDGRLAELDGADAADPKTTLALYMAHQSVAAVASRLIAAGRSPATPALAVENAGRPDARVVFADLQSLPAVLAEAAFDGPVVILVGEVVRQAEFAAFTDPNLAMLSLEAQA